MRKSVDTSFVLDLPLHRRNGAAFASADAYGHTVTVSGAVRTLAGYRTDGIDDVIAVPDHPALALAEALTVEVWVRPVAAQSGTGRSILGKTGAFAIVHDSSNDTFKGVFAVWINSGWVSSGGPVVIPAGRWSHVVGVYDRRKVACFVDGNLRGSRAETRAVSVSADDLYLGALGPALQPWPGEIGEVRVYGHALGQPEITRSYLATKRRYQ